VRHPAGARLAARNPPGTPPLFLNQQASADTDEEAEDRQQVQPLEARLLRFVLQCVVSHCR
jgi:hypothetical protein